MQDTDLLEDVTATLRTLNAELGSEVTAEFDGEPHWISGTQVAAADPIVASVRHAASAALGTTPPLGVFPGTTVTSWFAAASPALPCLPALGPGLLRHCHAADEWVSVAALERTVPLYDALVRDFCAPAPENRA
jgi:acetylornithine deacetylase/succinyl-diaminopimelate desuccinylase-like protein